ncbi:helix-turn-helix transcriptional regulator [Myroides sp. 1354]|uniref:AraC family transcriptional regulator n=1 Tax=unclassified Myroides TaxID=2642485 RepID=UPI0025776E92|nr:MULTISPECIES: AraC family transcriptional regulator [unclassified Myroides]MDM1045936.1 helix-turn-helix transcriptional regulator [Myroides sp. R163-1]MDM1056946.1 helix-turn-helix transcriptional regulator [Myroides sp. 1354]MDM1070141.1 helix-turn-helix transcriptional regulator [Myroides sp. 1372]
MHKQKNNLDPLVVQQIDCLDESWTVHSKAEITLVYILEGEGKTRYDTHLIPYQTGKLFLIPFDTHYLFQSEGSSRFLVVECPQALITQIRLEADRIETCDNMHKLTYITHHFHAKAGCVFREEADGVLAKQLLYTIAREHQSGNQEYLIIRQAMAIILHLVARNLMQTDFEQVGENKKVQDVMKLITYVQQHIGNRKLLSIESLASTFGIAKSYLGEYFKKQVGVSLQDYILDYKMKLVEIRLKHSTMRLKEIAFELDFNDESHLSKLFKKYKNCTPSQYRKLHEK